MCLVNTVVRLGLFSFLKVYDKLLEQIKAHATDIKRGLTGAEVLTLVADFV